MTPQEKAFLDTIAISEIGPDLLKISDDGYNVIVGGRLFHNYALHPGIKVYLPNLGIYSTAAGRYQILKKNFDFYRDELELPDFGKASQDTIALQMARERGALILLKAGSVADAISRCSNIWASFPGNNYGQHQNGMENLLKTYAQALTKAQGGVEYA